MFSPPTLLSRLVAWSVLLSFALPSLSSFLAPRADSFLNALLSQSADNASNRMVRMARSQASNADELARRAVAESHAARERRSGAARINKRHHGDAAKRDIVRFALFCPCARSSC